MVKVEVRCSTSALPEADGWLRSPVYVGDRVILTSLKNGNQRVFLAVDKDNRLTYVATNDPKRATAFLLVDETLAACELAGIPDVRCPGKPEYCAAEFARYERQRQERGPAAGDYAPPQCPPVISMGSDVFSLRLADDPLPYYLHLANPAERAIVNARNVLLTVSSSATVKSTIKTALDRVRDALKNVDFAGAQPAVTLQRRLDSLAGTINEQDPESGPFHETRADLIDLLESLLPIVRAATSADTLYAINRNETNVVDVKFRVMPLDKTANAAVPLKFGDIVRLESSVEAFGETVCGANNGVCQMMATHENKAFPVSSFTFLCAGDTGGVRYFRVLEDDGTVISRPPRTGAGPQTETTTVTHPPRTGTVPQTETPIVTHPPRTGAWPPTETTPVTHPPPTGAGPQKEGPTTTTGEQKKPKTGLSFENIFTFVSQAFANPKKRDQHVTTSTTAVDLGGAPPSAMPVWIFVVIGILLLVLIIVIVIVVVVLVRKRASTKRTTRTAQQARF